MAGEIQQQTMREGKIVRPIAPNQSGPVPYLSAIEGGDAPFYRSIRFRLTLWYALALIAVVVAMGVSLHTLLERALTSDSESRLRAAAHDISGKFEPDLSTTKRLPDGSIDFSSIDLLPVNFDSVLLSGLWFQIVDTNLQPVDMASGRALQESPEDLDEALGDSDVFGTSQVLRTVTIDGRKTLILIAPMQLSINGVPVEGSSAGWLVVGEPLGSREDIIKVVDSILRLLGVIGVAIAVWGGWMLAGRALAPLGRITNTAESIASSDGSVAITRRLDVPASGDELTQLAATFNVMLDRIEAAFDTQRRFVSDASHELRTPLTSVRGNVDVLLRQVRAGRPVEQEDLVDVLGVVQQESARMSRLIEDLLVLARSDARAQGDLLKREAVALDEVAREAVRTAEQLASGQRLVLEVDDPPGLTGDRDRLVQLALIFLDNGIRHTPAGGVITVRVDRATDPDTGAECARLIVSDTGAGIAARHIPHLFERFYRAEDARARSDGGTGLGLSIALSIVRGHGGWIDVDSKVNEGATFTVWLPVDGVSRDGGEPEPPRVRRPLRSFRAGIPKPRSRLFSRPLHRP